MPIYTKFGDRGETRLFNGTRVRKNDLRVRAYGEVDELNSVLGVAGAFLVDRELRSVIVTIQQGLMAVGATLAHPDRTQSESKAQPVPEWVAALEQSIDRFESELPALRRFILPGGGAAGANLHVARTVCRRAERLVVELSGEASVDPTVLEYMNRLSDLLFVMARVANYREGMEEVEW